MSNFNFPLLIIGSGPSALTASIYAGRAKVNHLLISGNIKGGQLTTSPEIENFPGIPRISGFDLIQNMENHAKSCGGKIVYDNIDYVNFSSYPFKLTGNQNTYTAKAVIVATGTSPNKLGLSNEDELIGKGISYCATCDGNFYKDSEVAVVGGGNTAIEESLYLSKITKKVFLIHRRNELRGEKVLQERLFNNSKIEVLWNYSVSSLNYDQNGLNALNLINNVNNTIRKVNVKALFVAIGHTPNTNFLQNQLAIDSAGYIITKDNSSKTSVKGVFAAGDVITPKYRQAIISAGSGAIAALDSINFLMESK